ncbi:hypothetical protein JTB14_003908 [Gonioctena quinquepunctata]|nr:hypothetical protein JTB14_003908 [Gonioctena quinquepunctata]
MYFTDAVHSGIRETAVNKLLNCLNIPTIGSHVLKKYEREIGPALEAAVKELFRRAGGEERGSVIEKKEKLRQELPQDIVDEIYPFMRTLGPLTNPNLHPDMIDYDLKRIEKFDAAIGNIVNIIVSYDMSWKFFWNVKAMEPDVGTALVPFSILKGAGLNVRVPIGDEDSSTIAAVRQGNIETIFELADSNHLKKNFASTLYDLRKDYKVMREMEVIPHLKKCFSYALMQS